MSEYTQLERARDFIINRHPTMSPEAADRWAGYMQDFAIKEKAQLESENEALRDGHLRQLAETDYCYVCDGHGHNHADDCVLTGGDNA